MSTNIADVKQQVQNLIDLKGEDIDTTGPDIIESLKNIEAHIDSLTEEIDDLKEEVNDLSRDEHQKTGTEPHYEINADEGVMKIWCGTCSIDGEAVVEGLNALYAKGLTSRKIANILEALS